ncbi:putative two-component system response regulator [Desulfuromusa kysingii]|uniref:Putative two-component system response regulator n=1 Tax=Desulfuromusa kysingii TaxID=37625 RepID=A0A1H4AR31_9BACT|nr:HD domain-containing phosphohydrolase [Desulfuromusa kysingii]SEA38375.1 putative two-component system response regulator [Desulfuromusa kysingii]
MGERKHQILIVDDTCSNIDTLIAVLGEEYDLRVAVDGETALQSLQQNPLPDLVLLDIMMPGMDGYEVCTRLKSSSRTRGIGIIFLTALAENSEQAKGLSLGAEDYITKPFDPAIVKARVRIQLELKGYRDYLEEQVSLRTEQLAHAQEATIASMAIMAEYRDPETGSHIQRTKSYIRALAEEIRSTGTQTISKQMLEVLYQAAPLHDIGKVAIPDAILLKPGRLTAEEFTIMEKHTLFGSEAIQRTETIHGDNELLHTAAEIAEFHHEKWDGSGYPHGRRGNEIPLGARLMTIADVYDALISKRPYKEAFSHEVAVKTILEGDGYTHPDHFDPQILSCFQKIHHQFHAIALKFDD